MRPKIATPLRLVAEPQSMVVGTAAFRTRPSPAVPLGSTDLATGPSASEVTECKSNVLYSVQNCHMAGGTCGR
jgi:hypothetical protein